MKFSSAFVVAMLMTTSSGISLDKEALTQKISDATQSTLDNAVKDVLKIASDNEPFEKPCAIHTSVVHHVDSGLPVVAPSAVIAPSVYHPTVVPVP